jgi:hypothetical protein
LVGLPQAAGLSGTPSPCTPAPGTRRGTHLGGQLQHPQLRLAVEDALHRHKRLLQHGHRAIKRPAGLQVVGAAGGLGAAERCQRGVAIPQGVERGLRRRARLLLLLVLWPGGRDGAAGA